MKRSTMRTMLMAAGFVLAAASPAFSQSDYPNRPVRLIIPFPPGGSTMESVVRQLTQNLPQTLGHQILVDPRPGAGTVIGVDYSLEYGTDRLEILPDGFENRPRVLIVDDLLATGGTAAACAELVQRVGGELCGFAFIVELADLAGQAKLPSGVPVDSLLVY